MQRLTGMIWITIVTAVVTAVMTTAVLASSSGDDVDSGAVQGGKPSPVAAVQAEVTDLLRVFRRGQRSSDGIPGDPVAALNAVGDWQPGENPLLSRRISLRSGLNAYVWPMSNGVCYSSPGPGGCVPVDLLRQKGVLIGTSFSSEDPTVEVFGIAVDGIETVALSLADGREFTVPIEDSAFYVELTVDPTGASWTNVDGTTVRQSTLVLRPS